MDTVKGIVTIRRAAVSALVALLLAGVTWGVMSRGPSEAERAYVLACEAIREKLPEDQREAAVFLAIDDKDVMVQLLPHAAFVRATLITESGPANWIAVVSPEKVKANFSVNFPTLSEEQP